MVTHIKQLAVDRGRKFIAKNDKSGSGGRGRKGRMADKCGGMDGGRLGVNEIKEEKTRVRA